MVEIKIDNAKYMSVCIDAIASLIEEANMHFSKDGLNILAYDNTTIALVDFNMPKEIFSKYEITDDEEIGVNFSSLNKIMSRAREGESMTLKKDKGDKFTITFSKDKISRKYKVNSIDLDKQAKKIKPKSEIEFSIVKRNFEDNLKDSIMLSDFVNIQVSKDGLKISARGDMGELDILDNPEIVSANEVKGIFNLKFLTAMIKGCDKDNKIAITLGSNEPISLNYNIGEANLNFVLAPYLDEE
jgi:proliferating cell nuclear antigen